MMNALQMTKSEVLKGEENVVNSHKTGRNTVIFTLSDGTEICKYVDTHVSTKKPDGTVVLQSGGYRTQTTKERIWMHTGIAISQLKGGWYMPDGSLFYDGIVLKDREVISAKIMPTKASKKKIAEMRAKIAAYVALITPGNFPTPKMGDCFYCMGSEVGTNANLGDVTNNVDHLLSHVEEEYVVGSLLVNAMKEDSMDDRTIGYAYSMPEVYLWKVHKAVTRYLTRRLLPGVAPS
jgi:hypothetical protein